MVGNPCKDCNLVVVMNWVNLFAYRMWLQNQERYSSAGVVDSYLQCVFHLSKSARPTMSLYLVAGTVEKLSAALDCVLLLHPLSVLRRMLCPMLSFLPKTISSALRAGWSYGVELEQWK